MSDPASTPPEAAPTPGPSGWRARKRGLKLVLIGGVVAVLGAGAYAKYTHHRSGPFGLHGAVDPETAASRLDRGVSRVLARVDATAEQKTKVGDVLKVALRDLWPLRTEAEAVRRKLSETLRADTVDRTALEALRSEQSRLFEAASRRLTLALADTAEALTPAQRRELIERLERRRGWRG